MAKRIIDWTMTEGGILNLNQYNTDKKDEIKTEVSFDLNLIYPMFLEMNDLQKQIIVYGTKQKLADSGASEKELPGKVTCAKAKWADFLNGKFVGERSNSTGAAENKKRLENAKTASAVVSLEGLMMKQMVYPEQFTPKDEIKLAEFWAIKLSEAGKKKKK